MRQLAGTRQAHDAWSLAERPRTSCLRTLRSIRRLRASSTASSSIRDTSAARAAACWCRNRLQTRSSHKLQQRMESLRVGDPLDKNTDVGAINSREQLDRICELVESGVTEGAKLYQPSCALPVARLLLPPDAVYRSDAESSHRTRGDLRAGVEHSHIPHDG